MTQATVSVEFSFISFSFEFLLWITVLEEINFSSFDSSRDLERHVCVLDFGCKLRVSRSFVRSLSTQYLEINVDSASVVDNKSDDG